MNTKMKKTLIATIIAGFSTIAVSANAQSTLPVKGQGGQGGGISAGASSILSQIYGAIQTGLDRANTMTYAVDNFLDGIETAHANAVLLDANQGSAFYIPKNTPPMQQTGAANYVAYTAAAQTATQNLLSMSQVPSLVNPTPSSLFGAALIAPLFTPVPQKKSSKPQAISEQDITRDYTIGIPASDSIMASQTVLDAGKTSFTFPGNGSASSLPALSKNQLYYIQPHTDLKNSYFNANTLLFPPNGSYTSTAESPYNQQAARGYATFLSQDYMPPSTGINFAAIQNPLDSKYVSANNGHNTNQLRNKTKAQDIYLLNSNPTYQKYQLQLRNLTASRSLLMTMLNQIITERTPVAGLGKGLPAQYTDGNGVASPLQIENYNAYHRVNNPKWYADMNTASPAVLQRQTLYVMAEILAKLQQAHIDREKMITLQTLQAFESIQGLQKLVLSSANSVNKVICGLPGATCKSKSSGK